MKYRWANRKITRVSTEMVRLLLDSIGTDTRSAVILPTELVIRDSA